MSELENLANTDPLVGVLNRRAFVAELNRAIAIAQRYGHKSSLVFIDVDKLKTVNDAHGHAAGDKVLKAITEAIAGDIRQTDVLGRLGGDEFAVILTHTEKMKGELKAALLQDRVAALRLEHAGARLPASISVGVFEIGPEATSDEAIETADKEMYRRRARKA